MGNCHQLYGIPSLVWDLAHWWSILLTYVVLMLFRELLNLNDLDLYQRITSDKSKNAEKIKILDLLNKIFLKEK